MTMRSLILALACLIAAGGCRIGQTVEKFPSARTPAGIELEVRTDLPGTLKQFRAELLAVHDSELVLATRDGVLIAHVAGIRRAWSTASPDLVLQRDGGPRNVREFLRKVSRYPQGISPTLMQELLVAYHQAEALRLK